eukprot:jgi/Botrbrau1/20527/Bobra.145_2s0078.2
MRTNMIQTLLPFSDCLLEEDFRRRFHNRRAVLDIVTAAFVMYHVSKYMLSGETKGMDPTLFALWISLTIAEILVMCGTFHPGYISWRLYIMMGLRAVSCILLFWSTREALTKLEAPTFSKAAFYVLLQYSRFRFPLFMALLFQIPLKQGQIVFQTVLVSFLLAHSSGECRLMIETNPDIQAFAKHLEDNYVLWREEGSGAACRYLCDNLLACSSGTCMRACQLVLPTTWRMYGPPWMTACVRHRYLVLISLGYVLPMAGLYVGEVMERHAFAKSRGLRVPALSSLLRTEAPAVLREAFLSILSLLSCFRWS